MTVHLLWPDNTITSGWCAADVLTRVARRQWAPTSKTRVKHLLSDRAWVWSGSLVDPELSDDEFLDALERAEMVLVFREDEEVVA